MYIPEIGDVIVLTQPWTFDLYNEYRNETMMEFIGDTRSCHYSAVYSGIPVTLEAGTKLKIDRIYVRKGKGDYSSITFIDQKNYIPARIETYSNGTTGKIPRKKLRFWAKLEDVNTMEFDKTI